MLYLILLLIIVALVCIILLYKKQLKDLNKQLLPTKLVTFLIELVERTSSNDTMEEACNKIVSSLCDKYDIDNCTLFLYENRAFVTIATNIGERHIPAVEKYMDSCKNSLLEGNYGIIKSSDCMLDYPSARDRGIYQSSILSLKTSQGLLGALLMEKKAPAAAWEVNMEVFRIVPKSISMVLENLKFHYDRSALAMQDGLTGAYNRRYMEKILTEQISVHKKANAHFCIAFFDIDHFKKFNDTYGHDMGDLVLKEIASFFKGNIRKDDYFFRYGGEEFVIFFPRTKVADIYDKLDNLRDKLSRHVITGTDGTQVTITISIGLAEFPIHGEELEAILKYADELMYKSKMTGRNRLTYE